LNSEGGRVGSRKAECGSGKELKMGGWEGEKMGRRESEKEEDR